MGISNYKCINFEGSDQVGKGDAVKNISLELANRGFRTSVISFPYYATPFGYIIREVLVNGFPKKFKLDTDRAVQLKMSLFSLNRLEILNCILAGKKSDIYVFDRGPFSNALTIAYHLFQNGEGLKKKGYLVDRALFFDSYLRDILNIDNCVICLKYEGIEWKESRNGRRDDLHEVSGVQGISTQIYNLFEKKIGDGWKNVVTKNEKGWREREDIKKECLDFGISRGIVTKEGEKKSKVPKYLGLNEIQRFLYIGSEIKVGLKREWLNAITNNDKKEVYRVSELVSEALASSTERLVWNDVGIVEHFKVLLNLFPEIFDIIEYKYGKSFVSKLKKSIK